MESLLGPSSNSNSINIRRDVQDAFYRYKMPRLQSKIEGKGNGIKTVVPNMVDIAKALHRPPSYITKFFGAELGALSTCDDKAAKYIVNGAHDAEKLQCILDAFIKKFVLCPKCDNPETVISVSKKDGTVFRTCQACGHRAEVDMGHKLVSYIRANPPPKPPKKHQAKDRANDASEMAAAASMNRTSSPLANQQSGDVIEGMVAPEDFDEGLSDAPLDNVDEDDWAEDTAAELRKDELANLSESVKQKLNLSSPQATEDVDPALAALDKFGDLLASNATISNDAILKEITDRDIDSDNAIVVIVQTLFAEDIVKSFKTRLALLEALVASEKDQKALLGSFERLVGVVNVSLMEKMPIILQQLYNADLVEEETLLTWNEKPSKRFVPKDIGVKIRQKAAPFFEWLAQDEDSDEEEEEEEESDDE